MRATAFVIAALLALIGAVWMGQGLGYIKGSFMTGDLRWFWIGLCCLAAGAVLALGMRVRRA
jgi:hypothetical protein